MESATAPTTSPTVDDQSASPGMASKNTENGVFDTLFSPPPAPTLPESHEERQIVEDAHKELLSGVSDTQNINHNDEDAAIPSDSIQHIAASDDSTVAGKLLNGGAGLPSAKPVLTPRHSTFAPVPQVFAPSSSSRHPGLHLKDLDDRRLSLRESELDLQEKLLDRRDREFERRDRELDRRERELERRERELDRREREFEHERARAPISNIPVTPGVMPFSPIAVAPPTFNAVSLPALEKAIADLESRVKKDLGAERMIAEKREAELEENLVNKVNELFEKERQTYYGFMRMSDHEVSEMVEDTVGYLMQKDEDIADRIRFQSLLYLSQEKLASEAGLKPEPGSDSLALAWRVAIGPSVVTEDRYNKAQELFNDPEGKLDQATRDLVGNKSAMEYVVEYTSHLRKEGPEGSEQTFTPGRIPREAYLESVARQSKQIHGLKNDALVALVDYISPETKKNLKEEVQEESTLNID